MKLLNGTMRPGRVIEVLGSGNVKVTAPGLFSEEDKDLLPTVMPFFGLHANTYSEPKLDDEVWVLNFDDNPLQLFWFRKDDRTEHNSEIEGEENVEVLCNREAGTGYATIYFSDGTGWMFRNGNSFINIRADGSIILDAGNTKLHVKNSSISLGSEDKSSHPGCFGDEVKSALQMISSCLKTIRESTSTNSITAATVSQAIGSTPENLDKQAEAVVSNKITLD